MKRWLLGLVIFSLSFTLGLAVSSLFSAKVETLVSIGIQSSTELHANEKVEEEGFVPEFRNLPTFDELYPQEPLPSEADDNLIEIFDDGIYRRSEVVAKNRETWLILAKKGKDFSSQRSTAVVKKLKTVSWPGDELDAKLSFKVSGKPIFAVKNIPGLKPGQVPTLFQEDEETGEELADGYRREFVLGDSTYVLRTSRGITKDNKKVAVLVLELNGLKQVLLQTPHVPSDDRDILGSLRWAGDFDRDGKLDFYIDEWNEKGSVVTTLYLSSLAEASEVVGSTSTFSTAGC